MDVAARLDPTIAAPPRPAHRRRAWLQTAEIDELADGLGGLEQRYIKLDRDRFSGSLQTAEFDDGAGRVLVFRERTAAALLEEGAAPATSLGLVLPVAASGPLLSLGLPVAPAHHVMTFEGARPLCLRTPSALDLLGIVIDRRCSPAEASGECAGGSLGAARRGRTHARRLAPPDAVALADDLAGLADGRFGAAELPRVIDAVLDLMATAQPLPMAPRAPACRDLVLRARALVAERLLPALDQGPTVADLCTALAVPRRTLQYAFARVLGIGPLQYLRCVRLTCARRALRAARCGVQQAALDAGFGHFSAFARDYRLLFGELPSWTLASAVAGGTGERLIAGHDYPAEPATPRSDSSPARWQLTKWFGTTSS